MDEKQAFELACRRELRHPVILRQLNIKVPEYFSEEECAQITWQFTNELNIAAQNPAGYWAGFVMIPKYRGE